MNRDLMRFRGYILRDPSPDGCWEWTGEKARRGYGRFWTGGRYVRAHRFSYTLHKGLIPEGMVIRHTCDNPPCVNPEHLLVGTVKQNAQDALERDRYRRGVGHGGAKLNEDEVREIRAAWAKGESQRSLARRFSVSRSAIQFVLSGKTWAHVREAS